MIKTKEMIRMDRNQANNKNNTEFSQDMAVAPTTGQSAGVHESYRGKPIRQVSALASDDPQFHSKQIVAVRKEGRNISAVQFQDGSTADIEEAIALAEEGYIEDVNTGTTRSSDGKQKTLRSYPDGDPSNNLDSLPTF
ncbi:DUF3892 domain-containing protein [Listeria phage LIS04]|nr:DUF3892 domain-containing protein [Listeria phage LIS04]